jgi:hypothetical protein
MTAMDHTARPWRLHSGGTWCRLPALAVLERIVVHARLVGNAALSEYVAALVREARAGRSLSRAESIIVDAANGFVEAG